MFPGQGSFTDTLLTEMIATFPELNRRVEVASSIVRKQFGKDLGSVIYPAQPGAVPDPIENDFELSQCVIYLAGFFLQEILQTRGVHPDWIVGHSVGEIPALAAAGAFTFEDGLRITCFRTQAIQQYAREGKMYALGTSAEQVQHLIQFLGDIDLSVAVINGKKQTVVSGSTPALEKILKLADAAGIAATKLKSAFPFHSPLMLKAVPAFANSMREIKVSHPTVRVFSPIVGRFYEASDDIREMLAFQLVQRVNFRDGLTTLYAQGARNFFETGGRNSLTGLARTHLENHVGFHAYECQKKSASLKDSIDQIVQTFAGSQRAPQILPVAAQPVVAPAPAPVATPQPAATVKPSADVQAKVLGIFKDLTNYPEEILELDADLESDLGLDSVKQIEIMSALMKEFSIPAQENIEINKYNTIRKSIEFIVQNMGGQASVATAPKAVAAPVAQPAARPQVMVKPSGEVQAKVLGIFKDLTNYPEEILELDADLESDLGLDSVKQIEIMSALMKEFGIPAQENIEINKYNTIRKSIEFIMQHMSGVQASKPVAAPVAPPVVAPAPKPSADVQAKVLGIFKDLTNYPEEILELDADLESDLGLDSVKQIEIMSALMKEFSIPAQENIEINKYNTIRKSIEFIVQNKGGQAPAPAVPKPAAPVPMPAAKPAPLAVAPTAEIQKRVLAIFKDLTNYPEEILELDADLESDLGLDSVKQIEIMSALMKEFNIPAQENIEINKYNTIRKSVEFIAQNVPASMKKAS